MHRRTRPLAAAALLVVPIPFACDALSQGKTAFSGEAALGYAQAQVNFGPRVPGTPAAQKAGDWIIDEMRKRADTVIVQSWTHITKQGDTLPMRNIIARFKPASTERVLYVAHWDTRPKADNDANLGKRASSFDGANDGASGVGLLVALGDALKKAPPSYGVDLLFVDGEDWGEFPFVADKSDVLIGSSYFAKNPVDAGYKPLFGVVWDMIGDVDLRIPQEGHSVEKAPEVVTRVWQAAAQLGYGKIFPAENQGRIDDDHVPLLAAGMRVIDVLDINYPHHHASGDTMDKISAKSLQIVGDVALTLVK